MESATFLGLKKESFMGITLAYGEHSLKVGKPSASHKYMRVYDVVRMSLDDAKSAIYNHAEKMK